MTGGPDAGPVSQPDGDDVPLRVSTLEIFFDLVFAFTLTQLTSLLASKLSWLAVAQVLLVFGLLWWMYGAYAWLTNSRPPVHATERVLLVVGMAGFLVVGLAIPRGFASYGVVLGLGYLVVVLVHTWLYYRVNTSILRVAPFNIASALLVTGAGLVHGSGGTAIWPAYLLWVAALALQLGSPMIVPVPHLFELRPAHFSERHSALMIVAIGESVAAIGIGAAGPAASERGGPDWQLLGAALLGLAVAAALWWIVFGSGDEERAERALTLATSERRTKLALSAYFYGFIPMLLGLIALAAGILRAVVLTASGQHAGTALSSPVRAWQAGVLAAGAALFLAGNAINRRQLATGPVGLRWLAALASLATVPVGLTAGLEAQLAVVALVLVAPLVAETGPAGDKAAGASTAG